PRFGGGAPKQSIYRFRGADVHGMVAAHEEAEPAARASLLESFRSRPEVVAFHNALFGPLFQDGGGGEGIAYEAMESRASFEPGPEIPVEVLVVDAGRSGDAD